MVFLIFTVNVIVSWLVSRFTNFYGKCDGFCVCVGYIQRPMPIGRVCCSVLERVYFYGCIWRDRNRIRWFIPTLKIVCNEFEKSHCYDFAMWHFRVHIRWIRGVKSNMVENMVGNMVGNMVCFRVPELPKHGTKHGWLVSHKNCPVAGEAFHKIYSFRGP